MTRKVLETALSTGVHRAKCGRSRHKGAGPCGNPAGYKTDHPGVGACKYHGGCTPIKHGKYATTAHEPLRLLIEQYERDPDPLSMVSELATARAVFQTYLNKITDYGLSAEVVELIVRLVSDITRIIKRIEDVRAQNAISRKDFIRLMQEMARVVEAVLDHRVDQVEHRQAIKDEIKDRWLEIRLA